MAQLELDGVELVSKLESLTGYKYGPDQKAAILHGDGPLWITAGPGSGKTEVLVARTLKLLLCDKLSPSSVFLTTFTEKAADNLVNRIATYLDDLDVSPQISAADLRTGTLHSLCDTVMREHRYPDRTRTATPRRAAGQASARSRLRQRLGRDHLRPPGRHGDRAGRLG